MEFVLGLIVGGAVTWVLRSWIGAKLPDSAKDDSF